MDNAYRFMIRTMKFSIFVFLFELFLITLFFKKPLTYVVGLILGYSLNLLFFRAMYLNVKSKIEMESKKAIIFTRVNYAVRMIITGLFFYLAIKSPKISLLTCVIGLLNIKIAIYVSVIYDAFSKQKG